MIIGIDAFPLAGRIAGIGRYVLEIARALDELMPEAEFILYSPTPLRVAAPTSRWHVRLGGNRATSSYGWLKTTVRRMAQADRVHVFWATRTILPARTDAFRTVSTVHDLNYRMLPASMPRATLWAHRLWFARDVRRADAVVANSHGTAARLRSELGIRVQAVAHPGVSAVFQPQSPAVVATRLGSLGVRQPYFLAVGTMEPRKNLRALIEAFVSLKRSGELAQYGLRIAGCRGWRDRSLQALLSEAEGHGVVPMGFVADEDLAALYAGAAAFVLPSLYEGFGIPAAEARACGTRVVATDLPELREAAGPSGIYVEPTVAGIRQGLLAVVNAENTPGLREKPRGWMEAGRTMADVFARTSEG